MPGSAVKEAVRFVPSRRPSGSSDLRHPAPLRCFTWNRAGARGVAPEHLDAPARRCFTWNRRRYAMAQGSQVQTPAPAAPRGQKEHRTAVPARPATQVGTLANTGGFHVELRSTALRDLPPGPPSTAAPADLDLLAHQYGAWGARQRRVRAEGVGEPVAPSLRWAGGRVATEALGTRSVRPRLVSGIARKVHRPRGSRGRAVSCVGRRPRGAVRFFTSDCGDA